MNTTYENFENALFTALASDLWCREARFRHARKLASTASRDGYEKQVKAKIRQVNDLDDDGEVLAYFRDYIA